MLERLSVYVYKMAYGFCVALFALMMSSMLLQIFCRYVLDYPLLWPEELTRFSMIWLAFIGGSNGVRKGVHVSFRLIVDKFSERARIYFGLFQMICLLFFTSVCAIAGIHVLVDTIGKSPGLNISYFYPKLGIILGFSFILIHTINFTVAHLHILLKETQS